VLSDPELQGQAGIKDLQVTFYGGVDEMTPGRGLRLIVGRRFCLMIKARDLPVPAL
jgi:hypothetical protein